ncbi:MAG: UbiD family decarboxylase [Chloroflexi bacterium]|nr:UbiD family decarboxylase [Chloroflexota bacterium]
MGELRRVSGAHWDLEIGYLTEAARQKPDGPALLFDDIPGYPRGYRVLTCPVRTPSRVGLTLGLPTNYSTKQLIQVLREKVADWNATFQQFAAQQVEFGPVLDNVHQGADVDLLEFPAPKWHQKDGGRYIGTGDTVVTRDPETGAVNLGTYRIMVHDRRSAGLNIEPGRHGRINLEKWHDRGQACPVLAVLGMDPLLFRVAAMPLPYGMDEYLYAGAIQGEPVRVITEPVTGLPMPADAEVVIAGWCRPGVTRMEGPFGEALGYYASKARDEPVLEVEAVYHRNEPILLGSPPSRPPNESSYFYALIESALLHNALTAAGVPDVVAVWAPEGMTRQIMVVSVKQRYPGHARQAAILASQLPAGSAYGGRYVIVVDEDIDPTNTQDVLWALGTRSDPATGIDIQRRTRGSGLDPMVRRPAPRDTLFNSRAIIDACKPFEWKAEFAEPIEFDPELLERVQAKWPI